jgi:predicted transcriptional regulator
MKGAPLPREDHIARYCGGSHISEDGLITPTAFHLRRDQNEKYLSVDWLEILNQPDRISEIAAVRGIISQRLRLGKTSKIGILKVGEVIDYVINESRSSIRILHGPEPDEPSHSGIYDTDQDEELIAELIAEKVLEIYPAVSS